MYPPATAMYLLPSANAVLLVMAMMLWLIVRHSVSPRNFPRWRCLMPAAPLL
jgi:hypothetical protein